MRFNQIVKELRYEKGYNQTQFAKLLNKTQSTISDWENERSEPSIDDIKELSKFLNVSIDYLLGNTDEWGNVVLNTGNIKGNNNIVNSHNVINAKSKSVTLNAKEEQLIVKYRQAPTSIKEAINKLLS